jgi:hypothetical protein
LLLFVCQPFLDRITVLLGYFNDYENHGKWQEE